MLWLSAAILLLIALCFLTLAVRGRREGDAPHCRACGFDLTGVPVLRDANTLPPRCPECGRELTHHRSIVRGRRVRRPLLLAAAGAVLLLALALGGLALSAANGNLNPYKPAWLLEIEATRLRGDARDAAATELLARHKRSPLNAVRLAALVNPAIDAQRAPATWENSPWWKLLDAAFAARAVSERQRQRYAAQALAALALDLPEFMLASEPWPARVARFEPELSGSAPLAPAQPVGWIVTLENASLDGRPLPLEKSGHEGRDGWKWTGTAQARSVTPMGFGFSGYTHIASKEIPFPHHRVTLPVVEPGPHSLSLEYTVRAFAGSNLTLTQAGPLQLDLESPTSTWTLRTEHAFEAKAETGEIARFATPDESRDFDPAPEAHPKINLDATAILPSEPPRTRFMYSVSRSDIRPGTPWIVGRVELRSNDRVWPALHSWPLRGQADPIIVTLAPRPHSPQGQGVDLSVADFPRLDKVDVVIVPDLHAAAVAGINAPIWGEEIVIKDVAVNWFQLPPEDADESGNEPPSNE